MRSLCMTALQPMVIGHPRAAWQGWRWIGIGFILGLIIAAVAVRESEHASQVQHLARGFFSSKPYLQVSRSALHGPQHG